MDKSARLLLVLQPSRTVSDVAAARLREELPRVEAALAEWWRSGRKFGVLVVDPYLHIHVAREDAVNGEG